VPPGRQTGSSSASVVSEFNAQIREKQYSGMSRRKFLNLSAASAGGLLLGFYLDSSSEDLAAAHHFQPNAFINIRRDGAIWIYSKNPEVGQGVKTSLPMIVAEELDAAWHDVTVLQAPVDAEKYGPQFAGRSSAIPDNWDMLRRAGAIARTMLVTAAAQEWGVAAADCSTANSEVQHEASGRRIGYGELVDIAAALPLPDAAAIRLKGRNQYKLLGTRIPSVDNEKIVTGTPLFGIDTRLPGMLYAVYEKCAAVGGRVAAANLETIRAMPGVKHAFVLPGNGKVNQLMPGIAIVADSTWAALRAKSSLKVDWDESAASNDSWAELSTKARNLARNPRGERLLHTSPGIERAFESTAKNLSACYEYPFVAHVTMEPQNCTAWKTGDSIEIWAPTQIPGSWGGERFSAFPFLIEDLGFARENITVHMRRAGGAFGRRLYNDFVCEAAAIASRVDAPVQLVWTREDDIAHDHCRAGGFHALRGGLDENGTLVAFTDHFISFTADGTNPVDGGAITGDEFPATLIAKSEISQSLLPLQTPCGLWRAPGSNVIAFAVQSFLHELSVEAGIDHLDFLIDLLGPARWLKPGDARSLHTGRAAHVIRLAAEKARWGVKREEGRALGLAFWFSHSAHVAEIVDVSVRNERYVTVNGVYAAVDIGQIINRSGAESQVEGAIVDGLSAFLMQQLTIEDGRIQQSNFDNYKILRMSAAPPVEVHFIESDFPPTGLGEPAVPPIAPAVANAIFSATGRRIRSMPLAAHGFRVQ